MMTNGGGSAMLMKGEDMYLMNVGDSRAMLGTMDSMLLELDAPASHLLLGASGMQSTSLSSRTW
jgi:hypothetical protein